MFSLLKVQEARVSDYTSLCKRSKTLNVSLKVYGKRGALDVVVDSTGLKVYGEGEWKVYKHGRGECQTWRKLHIATDAKTPWIVAAEMTSNSRDDASVVPDLLTQSTVTSLLCAAMARRINAVSITQPHDLESFL